MFGAFAFGQLYLALVGAAGPPAAPAGYVYSNVVGPVGLVADLGLVGYVPIF